MTDFLAVATLASSTGVTKDAVTNSFAVKQEDGDGDEVLFELAEAIQRFYIHVPDGGLVTMSSMLSPTLSRAADACKVEIYDVSGELDGGVHGSPVFANTFTIDATGGAATALPSEVAFVITLEALGRAGAAVEAPDGADPGTEVDRPKQRHTGRIYFGPLGAHTVSIVDGVARPASNIRDTSLLAMQNLASDLQATDPELELGVWSRRDGIVRVAHGVSCDNSFDTQRRRGESPTIRVRELL